jgi:glutathione S-transferase
MTLFHVAEPADWARAERAGVYDRSTRGRSLTDVGCIHLSRGDQWPRVREAFYGDLETDVLLVEIDDSLLGEALVWEMGAPGSAELFPHLYAPLPLTAVVSVSRLHPPHRST